MDAIPPLAALGRRIMILGPSNAGKSTLAVALGEKLGIPCHHIDSFRHLPHTDWEQRPAAQFHALHDAVVAEPEWILEGNYSEVMPQRLNRATSILVIDAPLLTRYRRYFVRTLFQKHRAGMLEGAQDSVKWVMVHWLWKSRRSARKYREMARRSGLPHVFTRTPAELDALYVAWGLRR